MGDWADEMADRVPYIDLGEGPELAKLLRKVHDDALEKAAKACEERAAVHREHIGTPSEISHDQAHRDAFEFMATEIRALKTKEPDHG